LLLSPAFSLDIQAQIPAALCTIHNFIRFHDPSEGAIPDDMDVGFDNGRDSGDLGEHDDAAAAEGYDDEESHRVTTMRNRIAEAMWIDYQRVQEERNLIGQVDMESPEPSDDEDEPY